MQARPIDGLHVTGSVGYLDATYDDFPDAEDAITGDVINRKGERLAFFPEWQTNLAVQYSWELPSVEWPAWLNGHLTPRLEWAWESDSFLFNPQIPLHQDPYHLLNVRLSYDFNEDRTQIAFWGTNVTDEEYFRNGLSWARLTGQVVRFYDPPAMFGLEITHRLW